MTYQEILAILSELPEERQREILNISSFTNLQEYIKYLKRNKVL